MMASSGRRTTGRVAMATTVGMVWLGACSAEDSDSAPKPDTSCENDFQCPPGSSCDRLTSQCVDGMPRDNYVSGKLSCRLNTVADPGTELGSAYVSGALSGTKLEFTMSSGCETDPSSGLTFVVLRGRNQPPQAGQAFSDVAVGLNVPTALTAGTGQAPLAPWVTYQDDKPRAMAVLWNMGDKRTIAYGESGIVNVTVAAVESGNVLELTLDLQIRAPQAAVNCSAWCDSQADCGGGPTDGEGTAYPVCYEEWDGGPRRCTQFCVGEGVNRCLSAGGLCDGTQCALPYCGQGVPSYCDATPLDDAVCDFCCNEQSQGGADFLAAQFMKPHCMCNPGAPCEQACVGYCANSGLMSDDEACWSCVTSLSDKSCISAAAGDCFDDPMCTAYMDCLDARCP